MTWKSKLEFYSQYSKTLWFGEIMQTDSFTGGQIWTQNIYIYWRNVAKLFGDYRHFWLFSPTNLHTYVSGWLLSGIFFYNQIN